MSLDNASLLYRSGDVFLGKRAREFLSTYLIGGDETLFYVSLWSFMHLATGVAVRYFIGDSIYLALIIHTIWEIWQLCIGMTKPDLRGGIDTLTDTAFFVIGFYLMGEVNQWIKSRARDEN